MWKLLRNLVLVAVVSAAALKLLLWYEVQQGASRLVARLGPVAQLRYDSVSAALNGEVDLVAVDMGIGNARGRSGWHASSVAIETPGALWLMRRLLLGDDSLPDHLVVTIKGLQAPATAFGPESPWLSPISLVPFETLGCGVVSRFSVADYQRMGLNPGAQQQRIEYRYDAAAASLNFSAEFLTPPFSTVSLRGDLQKFDPHNLGAWQNLHAGELAVGYVDGGYLAKRNRFCAQQAGITPAQFVEQHVAAVTAFLETHAIQPSIEVAKLYRNLVAEGGRISVLSLPPAASTLGQLLAEPPDMMTRQLNLTARRNEAPPVMVRLAFKPTGAEENPPPAAAAETGAAPAPAVAATAPKPTAPAPPPSVAPARSAPTAQVLAPPVAAGPQKPVTSPQPAATAQTPNPKPPAVVSTPAPVAPPRPGTPAVTPTPAKPAAVAATPTPARAPAPAKNDGASGVLPSGPAPPPDSTLALVWKPTVDRLEEAPPPARDYDVIDFGALTGYSGRLIRILTTTGKKVDGHVIGVDSTSVALRIQRAGGTAELHVPRSIIFEIRVPHARGADNNG